MLVGGREVVMTTYEGHPWADNYTGTPNDDVFNMGSGGNDTVNGGDGNDTFNFGGAFSSLDTIIGGSGIDALVLRGNYFLQTLQVSNTTGLERVEVFGHRSYSFDFDDIAIASGDNLTVDARFLRTDAGLGVRANNLAHATLILLGSKTGDALSGGSMGDTIFGGLGRDNLVGDTGVSDATDSADVFLYKRAEESTVDNPDQLYWDPTAGDRIDLRKIDTDASTPGNQRFHFIGTDAFSHSIGELRYEASNGGYLVTGDLDGDGAADFAIQTFENNVDLPDSLVASEFVL
jgi:Ca2+-binding RTX toxin-like protein